MKKRFLLTPLSQLIIISFIITFIPITAFAAEIPSTDPNLNVKVNVYIADSAAADGYKAIIKDGVVQEGSAPYEIEQGQSVMFEILWNLQNSDSYNGGDYFIVPIPETYFLFNFTDKKYPITLSGGSEVVGQFEVIKSTGVVIYLNSTAVEKAYLEDGYVRFTGTATELADGADNIKIWGQSIPLKINEPSREVSLIGADYGKFHKGGAQVRGTNTIRWELLANIENYKKAVKGDSYELLTNILIIDKLGDNQSIGYDYSSAELAKRFRFEMPVYAVSKGSDLSNYLIASPRISFGSDPVVKIGSDGTFSDHSLYPDLEAFIDYIERLPDPYVWGIYESGFNREQTVVFKLPDMEEAVIDTSSYNTVTKLTGHIDSVFIQIDEKVKTKERFTALQTANGGVIPVLAYRISIVTDLFDESVSSENNQAELRYNAGESIAKSIAVNFSRYTSGVSSGENGSLEIIKIDGESNEDITGASFRLQVYNSVSEDFEDYVPKDSRPEIRASVGGQLRFSKLAPGRYKIIETSAAEGYDLSKTEFVGSEEFEITGNETQAVKVTVKNYKKDTDDPDPENSGSDEQGTDVSDDLDDHTDPYDPGTENDDPAQETSEAPKTGSDSSMQLSICLMLISSVCLLRISLIKLHRQKD